jgi:hypothetical protein
MNLTVKVWLLDVALVTVYLYLIGFISMVGFILFKVVVDNVLEELIWMFCGYFGILNSAVVSMLIVSISHSWLRYKDKSRKW